MAWVGGRKPFFSRVGGQWKFIGYMNMNQSKGALVMMSLSER